MSEFTEKELEEEIERVLNVLDNLWATPRVKGIGSMIELYEEYNDKLMRMYYKGDFKEEETQ